MLPDNCEPEGEVAITHPATGSDAKPYRSIPQHNTKLVYSFRRKVWHDRS